MKEIILKLTKIT